MVKPGVNHVLRRPRDLRNARIRRAPTSPNSPRESAVRVVMPRAMKPDWVSKSKVRQTMWRGTAGPRGRMMRDDIRFRAAAWPRSRRAQTALTGRRLQFAKHAD